MSLTINSFKNMDFFKILEKLKELNPKFDYKSNSIIADGFKIKFIPFENIIVISSLKNGESIKFANKTLDCLSGLVSDDVLFNLMENYDIEELFKKKSINEELFENFKKLKNDSDTYVSKLMERYEDGLTVEERNKIKEEIKSYTDLIELCDNSMIVKTGETSVEYEYKKFRFGIIISEPNAAMRLNKAFLLQAFVFNLQDNLISKTYYITYEEAVNLGFDPESMKNILNSQVTRSIEYVKAFGISEEIRHLDLVKEFNRLEYYHKKGVIYDSTYYYVIEHLYHDREDVLEESYKEDLVIEEIFNLLKSKNGVNKFLSIAKRIINFESDFYDEVIKYEYKGHRIHLAIYYHIEDLSKLNIEILKNTDNEEPGVLLYYKDVIKLGFNKQEIIDCIFKTIIKSMSDREIALQSYYKNMLKNNYKLMVVGEILSNPIILKFLNENKNHKDYEKVMNLLSSYEYKNDELYEGINLSEKRATKEDIKNEVFDLLKSENGVDKFLSSAKFITSGKKSYSIITEYYYVQYNYKGCKIDIDWDLLVCSIKNLLLTVSIDIDKLTDLYYKDVIKLGFPEKEIIDSIYKKIINVLDFWIEELDEVRKKISITDLLSNSKIMGFLYENKNHKEYERVMKLISLLTHEDDELYEEINLSEKRATKEDIKNEVFDLLKSENGVDKFLSSAKFITSGKKSYSIITEYYYVQYNYKGCKIDIDWDLLVCSIKNLLLTVSIDIDKLTDLYYKDVIKLGFPEKEIIDSIYKKIINVLDFWIEELDEVRKKISITDLLSNSKIMGFLYENKNHKEYKKVMNLLSLLAHKDDELYESDYNDSISEKQNNLKILDEVRELFQTSDGIDKFLSSAKLVENNNISSTLFLCNIKYIYKNTEIRINFISLGDPDLSYKNIFFTNLRIDCKDSMFFVDLYYKEAIRLGFDKQKLVDNIYLKLINDIQYDSHYKSLNEFEKIKKISYILNNQEIINFLNDNKNNVWYEKFMNIIKSLDYKKATNIINPVDSKDVLYEDKNNSKENDISDEVAKLLKSKKGLDKFLSEAEFDYKTTTTVNYKYKNKTVSIGIDYNLARDFDKVILRVGHTNRSNLICPVYYKDAIRLGFRKKIVIDHLFEKFFKLYNWYKQNKCYSELINDKVIKFLNDNKTHKDYRKAMRIIKHPYHGEGTIYESKDDKSFNSYPFADYDKTKDVIALLSSKDGIDKFMSEAEILKRYNYGNLYLYKNNIYEFKISPRYDNPTKISLNDFYSITGGRLGLPYTEVIKLGFNESFVVDMVYVAILVNIELYKHSIELFNDEVIKFVLAHKNHKHYKTVKNYLEKVIVSYGDELLESKNETTDDTLKELHEFNTFMESSIGIDKFLSKAKLLKSNEEETLYEYKNGIYHLYICPWWYDYKMKNLFIIEIGYERYSENLELKYTNNLFMDYRNAIKLGLNKDKVIKTIYDKIYRFLDDVIKKHKKIEFYDENELNEIMNFLEMSIDYSKEYQEAYNIVKNYITGKSPEEDEMIFESKRK